MHHFPHSTYYQDRQTKYQLCQDFPGDDVLIDGLHAMQLHFQNNNVNLEIPVVRIMNTAHFLAAYMFSTECSGDQLEYDDVKHYCKIIAVLMETARIMKTIDDSTAQVEELKKKVQDLEHQLHEKAVQGAAVVNFIGGNVTYNDNSNNYTIKK